MKYGFATAFVKSQNIFDYLGAIKKAGYDYVELPGTLIGSLADSQFSLLTEYLLSINLKCERICALFPSWLNCFTESENRLNTYIDILFSRFESLGVKQIGFGSGPSRTIPDEWSVREGICAFSEVLIKSFLPRLKKSCMLLNIEPLRSSETNLINTVSEAAELVESLRDKHFGIVADTLHMMSMNENPIKVTSNYLQYINHLHVSELNRALPTNKFSDQCLNIINSFLLYGYDKSISFETSCEQLSDSALALELIKNQVSSFRG